MAHNGRAPAAHIVDVLHTTESTNNEVGSVFRHSGVCA